MSNALTTGELLEIFSEEMELRSGRVADAFNDGTRLFARGVIPRTGEVATGDRLQAGVALKATDTDVCLHPYTFRLVCRNGAIMAQAAQSRHLVDFRQLDPDEAIAQLREAVRGCSAPHAFDDAMEKIRSTRDREVDLLITLMPLLSRLSASEQTNSLRLIIERFFAAKDQSQFGLMNAVTSVARDTADSEARWNLEELGGAIAAGVGGIKPRPGTSRRMREELVGSF